MTAHQTPESLIAGLHKCNGVSGWLVLVMAGCCQHPVVGSVCVCVTLGVSSHAGLTVTRCTGKDGGGIAISEGSPRIQRMVFSGNSAQLSGGAINLEASAANITVIQARSGVVGLR